MSLVCLADSMFVFNLVHCVMFCRQINDDELLIESPYLLARRVLVLQISEPHENQQMQLARRVT